MGQITLPYPDFVNGALADGDQVDADLAAIVSEVNGNLDNTNLKVGAGLTADRLASDSVTESKILNDAVTADKLRDDPATDANRAVTKNHIRDGAVTFPKLKTLNYLHSAQIDLNNPTNSVLVSTGLSSVTYTPLCWYATGEYGIVLNVNIEISGGLIQFRVHNTSDHNGQFANANIPANTLRLIYIEN